MFHECRYIKTNGLRCHGAALSGKPYCYFHMNLRRMHSSKLSESQHFQLPPIEDTASVLLAVGQVLRSLNSPYADSRRAGLLLYGLQIAAQLTARKEEATPSESVRTLSNSSGDSIDFSAALDDGAEILAPDKTVCEPPHDCHNCPRQDTCQNYEESEEDPEDQPQDDPDDQDDPEDEDQDEDDDRDGEELDEGDPVVKAALRTLRKDSPRSNARHHKIP